jgi:hypothetical protein
MRTSTPTLHALILTAVLAVGAPAATATSCTPHGAGGATGTSRSTPDPTPESGDDSQVSFSAGCDADNHAVHVQPDTAEARRAAEHTCQVTGAAIDNAPWPDGWHPVPLDDVAGGDR